MQELQKERRNTTDSKRTESASGKANKSFEIFLDLEILFRFYFYSSQMAMKWLTHVDWELKDQHYSFSRSTKDDPQRGTENRVRQDSENENIADCLSCHSGQPGTTYPASSNTK